MSDIGDSPTPTAVRSKKKLFRSSQKNLIIQTATDASERTPDLPDAFNEDSPNEFFQGSPNNFGRERLQESSQGNFIKVFMILGISLLLIAGFFGRSTASLLGIPVDSVPYSALYFEDPHLATTGVKPGSIVAFGIKNGSSQLRNFNWEAKVESRLLNKGTIKLRANQRITLKVKVTGGKPMDFVRISINTLKSPIVVVVTA